MTWDLHADAAKISSGSPAIKMFAQHVADILQPVTPPPPPPPSGMRVGVIGNVAGMGSGMQALVLGLGAKLIREDRGDYALTWAKGHGIDVIGIVWHDPSSIGAGAQILEWDNEPYENGYNGIGVAAWAKQAAAGCKQLRALQPGKPILLPVGPCWNGGYVNGVDVVTAINQAAPDVWQYVDGISVHPYSQPNPPVPGRFPVLDRWRANLKALGHDLPFWVTEVGWPTGGTNWPPAQTEAQQAQYLGDFITACAARGDVRAVMVYDVQDFGPRDSDSEHWFGVVRADGTHKPAYDVVKARLST